MASRTSLIGAALFLSALFHLSAAVTTHDVGGNTGWRIPSEGPQFYPSWARSQSFRVGDTLLFNFANGAHDVAKVSKEQFDSCNASTPMGPVLTNSPARVLLNTTGNHYFLCAVPGHCDAGQKLSIVVGSAGSATPTSPNTNSPIPGAEGPSGSTTPPPSTGETPSSASPLAFGFGVTASLSALVVFFFF